MNTDRSTHRHIKYLLYSDKFQMSHFQGGVPVDASSMASRRGRFNSGHGDALLHRFILNLDVYLYCSCKGPCLISFLFNSEETPKSRHH